MDSLVDLWVSSGKNHQRLYHGSTDDIVKELKAWVERRKAHNDVSMDVSWNTFRVADSLQQLSHNLQEVPQRQVLGMIGQVPAITATQMDNLDRKRHLKKEKERETLLAKFFLASLEHRGIRWPQMPHAERSQADACVCAFLGTTDQGFDARMELEILEDSARIIGWQAELSRRDSIRMQEVANDPIPGVNIHSIGLIRARLREEIANDPTISSREAITNATHGIVIPGALDFILGGNFSGTTNTPCTTGEATRATDVNYPTTNDTVVYIADMLGNINIVTGRSSSAAADSPLNMDTAASSSSRNATDTPDNTNTAANSTSSTAMKTGANGQTLSGMVGQDGGSKISKAKKKREGRKRVKAARAKEAVESAGGSVGNDEDEDDGKSLDLLDV